MSISTETTQAGALSLAKATLDLVRYYLGGRRGLILLSVAALGSVMALNWGWLVGVGVAPLLLALAPCAAMCALGLCMSRMGGKSCSTQSAPVDPNAGTSASSTATTAKVHDEPLAAAIEPAITRNDVTHERS